jgi:two-component system cell cycle response regulator
VLCCAWVRKPRSTRRSESRCFLSFLHRRGFGEDIRQSDYPQLLFQHEAAELGPLAGRAGMPLLARYTEEDHGAFFPDPIPAPASVALMPLYRNARMVGALNFGSADPDRFADGMSTDFLAHMASIVAVCLENVINKERLQHMGLTDALTGVHNRRYLEGRLLEEIERGRRHGHALSCLYLDIDHFKQVNDRIGHQAGDQVLREVAARIKAELRLSDTLGRFGGEEFVVLLAETAADDARNVAERIRESVSEQPLAIDAGEPLAVSISIGVASVPAAGMQSAVAEIARQLLGNADRALYRAKEGGRNRVVVDAAD